MSDTGNEASKLADLPIEYPSRLSTEQVRLVLNAFRDKHPEHLAEWIKIERGPTDWDEDPLREMSSLFHLFAIENLVCESSIAVSSLFFDLRMLIQAEAGLQNACDFDRDRRAKGMQ